MTLVAVCQYLYTKYLVIYLSLCSVAFFCGHLYTVHLSRKSVCVHTTTAIAKLNNTPISTTVSSQHSYFGCCKARALFCFLSFIFLQLKIDLLHLIYSDSISPPLVLQDLPQTSPSPLPSESIIHILQVNETENLQKHY